MESIASFPFRRLSALFLSAALLLGANGVSVTAIAVAARATGISDLIIGLLGSAYYAGFVAGVIITPILVGRVGHIRVFSAFAAIAAMSVIILFLIEDPILWIFTRFVSGIAFCGTASVLESWLNSMTSNVSRGRILSIYRIVDLGAVSGSQFLIVYFPPEQLKLFLVVGLMFCAALVPLALARTESPARPPRTHLSGLKLWIISPVAAAGILTIGLTNSAFRTVGPVYVHHIGLAVDQLAYLISLWVLAGALFQYPLGWASDRTDRRVILIIATICASLSCFSIYLFGGVQTVFIAVFIFGGFALPLYSLSVAHAYDHAEPEQYMDLAAALTLFFAVGSMLGPFFSGLAIQYFGASALFVYIGGLHFILVGFVIWRMYLRGAVPFERRGRFVWLLRTSPTIHWLSARFSKRHEPDHSE